MSIAAIGGGITLASKLLGGGRSQRNLTPQEKFEQRGFTDTFFRKLKKYQKGQPDQYGSQFMITLRAYDERNGTITRFGEGSQPVTTKSNRSVRKQRISTESSVARIDPDRPDKSKIFGLPVGWVIGIAGILITLFLTVFKKRRRRR